MSKEAATLNAFLEEIRLTLVSETKVTKKSYIIIGCYLHAFSMLYDTLVSNGGWAYETKLLHDEECVDVRVAHTQYL